MGRGEPALLVELAVIGQVGLRHEAEQAAALYNGRAVEQDVAHRNGQAYYTDDVEVAREVEQLKQRLLGALQQERLAEEVLAGVARDAKLGEHRHLYATPLGHGDNVLYLLQIVLAVGHPHRGHGGCNLNESVLHAVVLM